MDALRQGLLPLPSHGRGWSYVHSLKVYPYMDGCRYVFDIKFQRGLIINIVDGSVTKARIYSLFQISMIGPHEYVARLVVSILEGYKPNYQKFYSYCRRASNAFRLTSLDFLEFVQAHMGHS